MPTPLENYVKECGGKLNPAMTSYVANLQLVSDVAPEIAEDIVKELATQRRHLKLVASENYCSLNVQAGFLVNSVRMAFKHTGRDIHLVSMGKVSAA